jgi:glyoxylase-like metal-dependent hydrolase (beta-lactamase superfamily II)
MTTDRGAFRRTSSILTSAQAATIAVCIVLSPVAAQRGPQQPPLVKEGATEKISDHVYVIPDGANHTRGDIAFWVEPDNVLLSGMW